MFLYRLHQPLIFITARDCWLFHLKLREQAIRTSETVPEIFGPTAVDELLRNKQTEMQRRKFAATLVYMLALYEMITLEGKEVRQRTKYLLNQDDPSDSCREAEQNQ